MCTKTVFIQLETLEKFCKSLKMNKSDCKVKDLFPHIILRQDFLCRNIFQKWKKDRSQNINLITRSSRSSRNDAGTWIHLNSVKSQQTYFYNYCSEKTINHPVKSCFSSRLRAGPSCSELWTGWHQTLALTTTSSRSPSPTVTGMEISIQNRSVTSRTRSVLGLSKHEAVQLHHVCLWTVNPHG